MKYRAEVDGLRAVAVLPVIFFHAGFDLFSGGFVGVDVFFVISGYLITTLILSDLNAGSFSLVHFYERRARRILPALFLVMAACVPPALIWMPPTWLRDFGESLMAVSVFSSNVLFWLESGYFDTAAELKPLLHTWSLSIEEQFYIVFPLCLMAIWKLRLAYIVGIMISLLLLSLGIAEWGARRVPDAAFFLLPFRAWELLIGVLVALYLQQRELQRREMSPSGTFNKRIGNELTGLIGFGLIVWAVFFFDETTPFPGILGLIPTLGTAMVLIGATPGTTIYKALSIRPFVGIGLVSYSAYLWHQPIFVFARHSTFGQVSDVFMAVLCLISLLLALMTWHFVEKPFRNRQLWGARMIWVFTLSGCVLFSGIGFYLHKEQGFIGRGETKQDLSTIAWSPKRGECHGSVEPCEYFRDSIQWGQFRRLARGGTDLRAGANAVL